MNDKVIPIDHLRVLKKQAEDEDDRLWREAVLNSLDEIKERVVSGETTALFITEMHDEVGQFRTYMLGLSQYDHFTLAGILEMTKLGVLDAYHDEE